MKAKQRLGQNFLLHKATAERIVAAAELPLHAHVLEIGPGTGLLTRALLSAGHQVAAVETDADLIPVLEEKFAEEIASKSLTLIPGDIRVFDFDSLPDEFHVVANIPYYITGEILRLLLSANRKPRSVTVLVQKEVAERVARSKKESLLSLSVKAYGTPKYCFTVPKGAFKPAPKVDSAVLRIGNIASPFKNEREEALFFEILHAGFGHKRKLLANNLDELSKGKQLAELFSEMGISPTARAEDLPLGTWLALARAF